MAARALSEAAEHASPIINPIIYAEVLMGKPGFLLLQLRQDAWHRPCDSGNGAGVASSPMEASDILNLMDERKEAHSQAALENAHNPFGDALGGKGLR